MVVGASWHGDHVGMSKNTWQLRTGRKGMARVGSHAHLSSSFFKIFFFGNINGWDLGGLLDDIIQFSLFW